MWKIIPTFPQYQASTDGQIRNAESGLVLKQRLLHGYFVVTLMKDKAARRFLARTDRWRGARVNRLVCEAFHGAPPFPRAEAAHQNGTRTDNREDNLRWATSGENHGDKERHGTVLRGSALASVMTEQSVMLARSLRADGRTWREIAKHCNASIGAVRSAVTGRSWKHLACALMALTLAACGNNTPSVIPVCPTVTQWSNADQDRAADETAALPQSAMLRRVVADWITLRDQVRACRGH